MRPGTATASIETPIGLVELTGSETILTGVRIRPGGGMPVAAATPLLAEALAQMQEWFAGKRREFALPLAPLNSAEGERLRDGIASIPYGETQTYGTLGARIGSVARAVGQACKTNPYPIIIPCHRVTSASGPEFYSGGAGPRTKSWLLDFEYANLPPNKRTRLI